MKIGIDARSILNPEKKGNIGVGHYTYHLLRHLQKIDKKNEYVIFLDSTVREKDIDKFKKDNFSVKFFPYNKYRRFLPNRYRDIMLGGFFNQEHLDILHIIGLSSAVPPEFSGQIIVTGRGVGCTKYPELYPDEIQKRAKRIIKVLKANSDHLNLIVSSNSLKKDTMALLEIPEEKIAVVHEGIDERICNYRDEDKIKEIRKKYNLSDRFILYMGTIEPVKNIPRLMEAFKKAKDQSSEACQLAIAGKDGWMADEIRSMAIDLGIEKDVIFTGYIPPEDMAPLFQASCAFIFIPLYEGFGSPVVEAMACCLPIIASDIDSLKEVAGDAAEFVNPYDVNSIVDKMLKFSLNKYDIKSQCEKSCNRAGEFSWEKCARETLDVYDKIITV
ncbi:glycosyltransferase family 1 protein [bacterium]|nr:MAG: glycosyltransferase family 1 protein [bacterium]